MTTVVAESEVVQMSERRIVNRVCPFCEATCGLAVEVEGDRIVGVRGDRDDPFSRGYICPKAYGLKELYHDPERLRRPVRRTATGWEEAYDEVASRVIAIRERYGSDAIGMYNGNPVVHDVGALIYRAVLQRALGSRSLFNSAAIDTLPKIVQTGLMFGRQFPTAVPVPDIDRTHHLLIIGANPAVSHGSLMTMPDAPGRLKAVIARGGKVVVIDPRRTETARLASEHHFIRPGGDAALLLAMLHEIFDEKLHDEAALAHVAEGLAELRYLAARFSPERVEKAVGIEAARIRALAREFARTWPSPGVSISSAMVDDGISPPTSGCPLTRLFQRPIWKPLPFGSAASSGAAGVGNMTPPGRSRLPVRMFSTSQPQVARVPNSCTHVPRRP